VKILNSIVLVLTLLLTTTVIAGWFSKEAPVTKVVPTSEVVTHIERSQFTTGITESEPDNDVSELEAGSKVYFFLEVKEFKGNTLVVNWLYGGDVIFALLMDVNHDHQKWWSVAKIDPSKTGQWTVQVIDKKTGRLLAERNLNLYVPTTRQMQQYTIPQRLEKKTTSRCEKKMDYYNDKVQEDPRSKYYRFLLKRWEDKCIK